MSESTSCILNKIPVGVRMMNAEVRKFFLV